MKLINKIACLLAVAATALVSASCENDNINPYEYNNNGGNQNQGSTEVLTTKIANIPLAHVYGPRTQRYRKAWRYP